MTRVVIGVLLLLTTADASPRSINEEPPPPGRGPSNSIRFEIPGAVEQLRVGTLKPGGGYATATVPLETYVARVIAGEAARDSPAAALEALAITVRTFALANRGRHHADGFDLCDQTHCQVLRPATAATERAAAATAGRVLLVHDTAVASVFYSASCGGRTEIPSAVWPGADDPAYLPSHRDDACGGLPIWSSELRSADLLRALRAAGFAGATLRDVRVLSRTASGRVANLRVAGLTPDRISGQELRVAVGRAIGWQQIKSTVFDLRRNGDVYQFSGRGSGHGVGLCVIGSARLAAQGQTAPEILRRYFPGLRISDTAAVAAAPAVTSPEVEIALPEGDEGERAAVTRQALQARDDLARMLGVTAPQRIVLRFHATTDEYEQATDQPWFTSAAAVRGELHLLPIAVLRERGVLDRVIRHELVHILIDAALAGRPLWVREGAAVYFGGSDSQPVVQRPAFKADARSPCPGDQELRFPVSAGALSNAHARARACFARQIESGRSWRDVK
jgi:stage II sporulation protein D (peptidoglycan lytic transglycosylase)